MHGGQFEMYHNPKHHSYLIKDRLTKFRINIPKTCLNNSKFDLRGWYAKWRVQALGLQHTQSSWLPFGQPITEISTHILRSGIHTNYPTIDLTMEDDVQFSIYLMNTNP